MLSSSYYYSQYKSYLNLSNTLSKNISSIQTIRNQLRDNYSSYQSNVNRELSDLEEDLEAAVRHDSKFSSNVSSISSTYKEKSTSTDSNLSSALSALNSELTSLNQRKSSADYYKSYYYSKYLSAKKAESESQ